MDEKKRLSAMRRKSLISKKEKKWPGNKQGAGVVTEREVGQAIHGKTTEPVYAFDKLLIPVGTVVNGKVSAIDAVPKKVRTLDAVDGNFSPRRNVHVQFDELVMS